MTGSLLAKLLLDGCEDPAVQQFVSVLLSAAKNGHLCLTVGEDFKFLCEDDIDPDLVRKGALRCPRELIADVSKEPPLKPICREGNRYYLQRHWKCENIFKQNYSRLRNATPLIEIEPAAIDKQLVTDEQAAAIKISLENALSIISGGPGTGKTYTAGVLIQVLWSALSDKQKETMRFVLAAPTGKAAQNLQKSFRRVEDSLPGIPPLKANTLHAVLGVGQSTLLDHPAYLPADVILVDECSMIDVQMMANLMASVKGGARLIMLGDSHQLPPVEAGSLFSDMMKLNTPGIELTKCLRTESLGIIELSSAIHRGDDSLEFDSAARLEFTSKNEWKAQKQIVEWACRHFPHYPADGITPGSLVKSLQSYCLLSPFRKGPLGVGELNRQIMVKLSDRPALPIMVTKSSSKFRLFNGDTGLLIDNDKAVFLNEEGTLRFISKHLLPDYEYAFCMSVHKSQGSEFDHVTLLMPEGSEVFGREVFYTGVTRARKKLDIWGADETLRSAIRRKICRHSGLSVFNFNKL